MSAPLSSSFLAVSGLEYAFAQPFFPGKIILWTLLALSLFSWVVILSKVFFFYRSRAADVAFTRILRGARQPMQLFERHYSDAHSLKSIIYEKGAGEVAFQMLGSADRDATFAARLRSCDALASHQLEAVREAFRRGEEAASARLRKGMSFLSAASTGAPVLGLLGMVWILMKTFSQSGGESFSLPGVAPGVSGSLAVMVIALLVATPAIFAQIVLSTVNREKARQLGDFRAEAVRLVERFYCGTRATVNLPLPENSPAANIAAAAAAAAAAAIEAKQAKTSTRFSQVAPSFRKKEIVEPMQAYEHPQSVPEPPPLRMPGPAEEEAVSRPAATAAAAPPKADREAAADEPEPFDSESDRFADAAPPPLEAAESAVEEEAPPQPHYEEEAPAMAGGPIYDDRGGKVAARQQAPRSPVQLELRPLRPRSREKPVDTQYETPFVEPELSPLAQQTAVLMARRRGPGAVD